MAAWQATERRLKLHRIREITSGEVRSWEHRGPLAGRTRSEGRGSRCRRGIIGDGRVGRVYCVGRTARYKSDGRAGEKKRQRLGEVAGVEAW